MSYGWNRPYHRATLGGNGVAQTLAANTTQTVLGGSMESIDGTPLLVFTSTDLQINNSMNATASAFALQAPYPNAGPFTVVVEPSLNSTNFGINFTVPANAMVNFSVQGLYTNLINFGGVGYQGSQVNQAGVSPFNWIVKNLNTAGGNSFQFLMVSFLIAHPINAGDLGGYTFE